MTLQGAAFYFLPPGTVFHCDLQVCDFTWHHIKHSQSHTRGEHYLEHCREVPYCFIVEPTADQHVGNSCETKQESIREERQAGCSQRGHSASFLNAAMEEVQLKQGDWRPAQGLVPSSSRAPQSQACRSGRLLLSDW